MQMWMASVILANRAERCRSAANYLSRSWKLDGSMPVLLPVAVACRRCHAPEPKVPLSSGEACSVVEIGIALALHPHQDARLVLARSIFQVLMKLMSCLIWWKHTKQALDVAGSGRACLCQPCLKICKPFGQEAFEEHPVGWCAERSFSRSMR